VIDAFSNLSITISDGNTVPSVDFLGYKTYVDIGSGTVLKIAWSTPTATGNKVDYYKLCIKHLNPQTGVYDIIFDKAIGNVNEFYITSDLLSQIVLPRYQIDINLSAISLYGDAYNSLVSTLTVDIAKGCGTYIKVDNVYKQPIMKRALAFSKLNYLMLADANGKALKGVDGKTLYVKATRAQATDTSWALMQEFYAKAPNDDGKWVASDIKYEALMDANGEIITDINNEIIYTL
jgi:hypothetical protein